VVSPPEVLVEVILVEDSRALAWAVPPGAPQVQVHRTLATRPHGGLIITVGPPRRRHIGGHRPLLQDDEQQNGSPLNQVLSLETPSIGSFEEKEVDVVVGAAEAPLPEVARVVKVTLCIF
jgi:hypothetical protein